MEQIYNIKYMRKFEGKSIRKIAKITGHDFSTIKKYVEKEDFTLEKTIKPKREGKLSPYREIVLKWLIEDKNAPHKQQHTAKRIHDRLKELYPNEFNAHERSVRKFVAKLRKELVIYTDGFLPLEHPPGEAQADFGEDVSLKMVLLMMVITLIYPIHIVMEGIHSSLRVKIKNAY